MYFAKHKRQLMSNNETQARIELAAILQWADRLGLSEGICNHFSYMVPRHNDRFLINPHGRHWRRVTASSLVLVGLDGQVLEGVDGQKGAPPETSALFIHWGAHKSSPEARCVLHTHMPYATALTSLDKGRLAMCGQNALRFYKQISYLDRYSGLAVDQGEGMRIAKGLDGKRVAFLGGHGIVVTGPTAAVAFDDLYYLERAAQVQVLAQSTGQALFEITDDVAGLTFDQMEADRLQSKYHLDEIMAILDEDGSNFGD
jgi:ribulose-5-phosphate 4-epimerase/fuculose-1-phosphate aldolase